MAAGPFLESYDQTLNTAALGLGERQNGPYHSRSQRRGLGCMFQRATEAAKANRCKFNMRIRYICEAVRKNWENLCEANFEKTLLPNILLYQAEAENADFHGAIVSGGRLFETRFDEANMREAHLEGADLSGANLEGASINQAALAKTKGKYKGLPRFVP